MREKVFLIAILLASGYLLLLPWHPYPLSFVLKPAGIIALAAVAYCSNKPFSNVLAVGLLFGACGDVLLDVDFFLFGLGSFLISHLVYIALFVLVSRQSGWRGKTANIYIAVLAVFGIALLAWLIPSLGDMTVPVTVYVVVISLMAGLSIKTYFQRVQLAVGAALFVVSDAMIAVSMFKMDFFASSPLIWITYFGAQYCITKGFLSGWERNKTVTR